MEMFFLEKHELLLIEILTKIVWEKSERERVINNTKVAGRILSCLLFSRKHTYYSNDISLIWVINQHHL